MARKGLDQKDQLFLTALTLGFGAMYHLHSKSEDELQDVAKSLRGHMEDCAKGSAIVARIGYGVLVIVASGLILNLINAYHGNTDTTQRSTTVVEEKHIK